MERFIEKEEATTNSQLVGILPGTPPRVNLVDYGTGRNGIKRHMTQQVPILDDVLFTRLEAEVNIGDYIRATIVNEYTEAGSKFYLAEFQRIDAVTTIGTNTNGTNTNGTNTNGMNTNGMNTNGMNGAKTALPDMSQLPITTCVIEPIPLNKTKIHK